MSSSNENLVDQNLVPDRLPPESMNDNSVSKGSLPDETPRNPCNDESAQSPDISLSSQNTLRYCDVEGESEKQNLSDNGSQSSENFENATSPQDQAQFKNSFYEKLSVTYQNLENTVASLQKPQKNDIAVSSSSDEIKKTTPPEDSEVSLDGSSNLHRPETLSLSEPLNEQENKSDTNHEKASLLSTQLHTLSMKNLHSFEKDSEKSTKQEEVTGAHFIEPSNMSPKLRQGILVRTGDKIEFVADNLEEKIKKSSPHPHTDSTDSPGSRRSSVRSIASGSSSTSFATSSGVSRSPSSLLQQSPDDIPPIDAAAVLELESNAQRVADSLDLMMGNIRNNLHKMSAITIGCQDAYKRSVDISCDSVDSSIKTMYALMAKCEELSFSMKPVEQIEAQIREIKRILELFEVQLMEK